jgi:hypothetical protein
MAIEADGTSLALSILVTAESIAIFCSVVNGVATMGPASSRASPTIKARSIVDPLNAWI